MTNLQQQIRRHLQETAPESPEVRDNLLEMLAYLRAMEQMYYHLHWKAKGDPFYGDHLLFERLYGSLGEEYDGLAEKIASYFGAEALDLKQQAEWIDDIIESWVEATPDPIKRAVLAEQNLQSYLETLYEQIKGLGEMSLGLDDFIMALANDHEEHLYLLKQRTRN